MIKKTLDVLLTECATRRNEYAHADWIGMKLDWYVRVKQKTIRTVISYRYKRYDLARVQGDVEFIRDARDELYEFNERFLDHLRAHGEGPVEQL